MNNINFALLFMFSLILLSCTTSIIKNTLPAIPSKEWHNKVCNLIDEEVSKHKNECKGLEDLAKHQKLLLRQSDFENEIIVLDSLKGANKHLDNNDELVVIKSYQQGFNFWDCTSYLIVINNKKDIYGFESCKINVDPFSDTEVPEYSKKLIKIKRKEIKSYLNLKSDCNINGMLFITIFNIDLKIKKIHLALMPPL